MSLESERHIVKGTLPFLGDTVGFKHRRKLGSYCGKAVLATMWLMHWRDQG